MAVPHLLVARQRYSPVSRGYTESMSREMYPKSYVVLTREPVAKGCPLKNQSMRIVGSDLGSRRQSKCTLPPSGTLRLSWMRNYVLNQNLFITGSISTFSTLLNFFFLSIQRNLFSKTSRHHGGTKFSIWPKSWNLQKRLRSPTIGCSPLFPTIDQFQYYFETNLHFFDESGWERSLLFGSNFVLPVQILLKSQDGFGCIGRHLWSFNDSFPAGYYQVATGGRFTVFVGCLWRIWRRIKWKMLIILVPPSTYENPSWDIFGGFVKPFD